MSASIPSKTTLPVLANVLLKTEDGGLKLTATNLEIGINCWVPGKVADEGDFFEIQPNHAANIRTLAREKYFDGLAIIRVQDNYVTQWGDPEEDEKKARPLGTAKASFDPEFSVPVSTAT